MSLSPCLSLSLSLSLPPCAPVSIPTVLFDQDLTSLVISPLDNFMVGVHAMSK